jgi:hypothetical protein
MKSPTAKKIAFLAILSALATSCSAPKTPDRVSQEPPSLSAFSKSPEPGGSSGSPD